MTECALLELNIGKTDLYIYSVNSLQILVAAAGYFFV